MQIRNNAHFIIPKGYTNTASGAYFCITDIKKNIPMEKQMIGENAGIVWRALDNNTLSWEELVKSTELNPIELASAIGWLARENKINIFYRDGIVYFETFHETYY